MLFEFQNGSAVRWIAFALTIVLAQGTTVFGGLPGLTTEVAAKTPGSTYCFYRKCHRVKSLSEMRSLVGKTKTLTASFYDSCHLDRYNPCGLTSSGEQFYPHRADNAASPIYPDGTRLLVWSPISKQAAVVRINNAGPYWGNRTLDVSRALAETLGFKDRGVAKVEVRVLAAPTKAEARYKRKRSYPKVRGPIGQFASLDEAYNGLMVLFAFDAMASSMIAPVVGTAVTTLERPFEVAAKAHGSGRMYAALSDQPLAAWPVVTPDATAETSAPIRVASINWPVVAQEVTVNVKNVVRLASLSEDWPIVVRPDDKIANPAVTRLASTKRYKRTRVRRSIAASDVPVRLRQAWRKKRTSPRKARRLAARTRPSDSRGRKAQKVNGSVSRTSKPKTVRVKRTAKVKSKAFKRVPARRPAVATRTILHRAMGRAG